mmetsp:Transcript_12994/g.24836  ORF Transcript_12994/g.24836 Transcript_12994/m.24836 type:complete len:96 (-) Transcript_12994:165-452(-)
MSNITVNFQSNVKRTIVAASTTAEIEARSDPPPTATVSFPTIIKALSSGPEASSTLVDEVNPAEGITDNVGALENIVSDEQIRPVDRILEDRLVF